ncbi:Glutamate--tRNA ligase mitochondrial [Coemansia sp. RSA 552]|nr:Glutamate--tRNA ligase mitochondrial [Coemansia sp. RSA 552]
MLFSPRLRLWPGRLPGHRRCCSSATGGAGGRGAAEEPAGPVRVRFAPSPTGMLHLGGLRTALFNYLLARRYGGSFILRIEDTDRTRLVPGATENIVKTLEWAGLTIDEGPGKAGPAGTYFQSQRGDLYRKHAHDLLESGAAYRCFCSPQRLEALRAGAASQGRLPTYDRRCVHLSRGQIDEKLRTGEPYTIRLLAPNPADPATASVSRFNDLVYGQMHFRGPAGFDDAVLLKSDGLPTYHLANVVDDHFMGITHVLRGEEWLVSTPKHRALFRALGWPAPRYAHLPLLMNTDGTKLSKRNRDGPVQRYIDDGYLAPALVNYVALLGWSSGEQQELYTLSDLEKAFSIGGLGRSKSAVSRDRLDWLNRQHLRLALDDPDRSAELVEQAHVELAQTMGDAAAASVQPNQVQQALRLAGDRLTFTRDLYETVPFVFADPDLDSALAAQPLQKVPEERRVPILQKAKEVLAAREPDKDAAAIGAASSTAKAISSAAKAPTKHVMMMLRYALTGQPSGPSVPDLLESLSPETLQRRLDAAIIKVRTTAQ